MFAYSYALVESVKAELALVRGDRKGVTALEYGIMAALISAVLITAVAFLTGGLTTVFTRFGGLLT
jgi:pilus assembly protein Flp/PilA